MFKLWMGMGPERWLTERSRLWRVWLILVMLGMEPLIRLLERSRLMSGLLLMFTGMAPESVLLAKKMHVNVEFRVESVGMVPSKELLDNCQ